MDLDPAVHRYIYQDGVPDPAAHRAEILAKIADGWPREGGVWAVEWLREPGFLGWCCLVPLEDSGMIEIGYRFVREAWGQGIATESARAVLDHGFGVFGFDTIVAVAHPENQASHRVLEKIGMAAEGTAFHYGQELAFYRLSRGGGRAKSGRSYTLRHGRPDDGAAILRVHRRAILALARADYTEKETRSWATKLVPEGYGKAMTEGGEIYEVALDQAGRMIAFCSRREDEVVALFVDPDWAREGLGSVLLRRAEAAIAAAGHRRVRVGASRTGQRFYETHGYRLVERRGWQSRGGLVLEMLAMEKPLR
jgi:RimJ/RimL family protein N-acetyltransferase